MEPACVSASDPKRELEALDAKLKAFRKDHAEEKPHQEEHYSQAQVAWRMVTELVAGLGIGFGIGYGLDVLLGTTPFLMVVFVLLGMAAGINVMMRTAKEAQAKQEAAMTADRTGPQGGTATVKSAPGATETSASGAKARTGAPGGADEGMRDGD